MVIFILMLVFHWIGDFVLQSERLALNKSKDNKILAEHVLIYSLTMSCWYSCSLMILNSEPYMWLTIKLFFIITFVTHFTTDYITSRINSKLHSEGKIHDFFVMIGLDQTIHFITLIITLKLVL